jgi:tRNA threonylcarbamoyladenosine biosynthesis protein TsaE
MLIATKGSKIDISSEKKTEELAKKINSKIKAGDILFLHGEIGVGKTTFVKYLINDLQLKLNEKLTEVTSPTFNIMNEYKVRDLTIKHYDLYRLKSAKELENLNLFEENNNSILLIEWPNIIKEKPNSIIELSFEYENDYQNRFIKVLN